jgi:hypothetical protein
MSQSLISIDALSSVCWEKEREKEREGERMRERERERIGWWTFFSQGQTHLDNCASWDFCDC